MQSPLSSQQSSESAPSRSGVKAWRKPAIAVGVALAVIAIVATMALRRAPETALPPAPEPVSPVLVPPSSTGIWNFATRPPLAARFARVEGDEIVLLLKDGSETKVPRGELLPADAELVRAWSRTMPSNRESPSGAVPSGFVPTGAGAAMLPVELQFYDGTARTLQAIVMKRTESEALLTLLDDIKHSTVRQAFAIVDDERGARRVPLTLYGLTKDINWSRLRLILAGPKGELPAPFDVGALVVPAVGERVKFTGCDIATLREIDASARWTDEAVTCSNFGSSLFYRLSSGRRSYGIIETLQGAPVAVVKPAHVVPAVEKPGFGHIELPVAWFAVPSFPRVYELRIVKDRGGTKAKLVLQVFDPERKLSDPQLLVVVRPPRDPQLGPISISEIRLRTFTITGDRWTDKPPDGLEVKLVEATPEGESNLLLDPKRWPHVRFWTGEFVAARESLFDYQLVNVDAAGALSLVGESSLGSIREITASRSP